MAACFTRIVRFKDPLDHIFYGEAPEIDTLIGQVVPTYSGSNPWDSNLNVTGRTAEIAEVLCPIPETPLIYGIGLNYKSHIVEGKITTPAHPTVFTKPPDALNGPFSDVMVNPSCMNLDYEGELIIVVGQDCKNLATREEALDKILGYTVGNDVSSRWWQMPQQGGSHGFAKSFDGFAPVGPVIAAPEAVGGHGQEGIKSQTIITRVNGEERQRARLDDLLFDAAELLMHLTMGVTLRAGTLIMTGTPAGVGFFMKPQRWLEKGDVVEVSISGIGTIRNRFQ